jgi:hypothetical protein
VSGCQDIICGQCSEEIEAAIRADEQRQIVLALERAFTGNYGVNDGIQIAIDLVMKRMKK